MSDLVKVLIVGVIAVGAWVAIGAPTTIQDLRTDIDNIRNQFTPQNASAQQQQPAADQGQDQGQQQPAADQSGQQAPAAGGGGGGDADSGMGGGMGGGMMGGSPSAAEPPTPPDTGSTNGTAAPQPPAAIPPAEIPKPTPPPSNKKLPDGHPLAPPVATTNPIVGNHHNHEHATFLHVHGKKPPQAIKNTAVVHAPPHAVAKTHPPVIHHQFHHRTFLHTHGPSSRYKGDPGWYTVPGHHHCEKGTPGCICTDCSKCDCNGPGSFRGGKHHHTNARSHLAYSYYANNTPGDLFSYY